MIKPGPFDWQGLATIAGIDAAVGLIFYFKGVAVMVRNGYDRATVQSFTWKAAVVLFLFGIGMFFVM